MKTHFATLLCAMLCGAAAYAETIDETQANALATSFFASKSQTLSAKQLDGRANRGGSSDMTLVLKKARTSFVADNAEGEVQTAANYYYVYNRTGGGFVIVAGDDALPAILGYSLTGKFDAERMADGLTAYLSAVEEAEDNPVLKKRFGRSVSSFTSCQLGCARESQRKASFPLPFHSLALTLSSSELPNHVEALLGGIMWDQDYPYNKLTPSNAPVGCVATALAQVMRYYRWPLHSQGSHSYYHSTYGTLAVDYDADGAYNYDLMPESGATSSEQADELSKLCYHVGVAVDMEYTTSQSGAYMHYIPGAVTGYFKYDRTLRYLTSTNVGTQLFNSYIRQSIAEGCPVPFAGQTSNGSSAHAFVLDGYDESGRYHVNWGWMGLNDGYYYITDMQGYNYYQSAVTGLRPDTVGTSVANEVMLSAERVALTLGEDGTFSDISIGVHVYKSWSEERKVYAQFGLAAVSQATGDTLLSDYALTPMNYFASTETNSFNAGTAVALQNGKYFSGLADGDYLIRIYARRDDGSVDVLPLYASETESALPVTISENGTKWSLTAPAPSNVSLREGSAGYALNSADAADFSFVVDNAGEGTWDGTYVITYQFLNTQEGSGTSGAALTADVKIEGGQSQQFNVSFPRYYYHVESNDKVKMTLTLYEGDEAKTYDITPGYVGVNSVSQHTLTVSVVGEGTCEPTGVDDLTAVPYLTSVGFVLTPAEGYTVGSLRVNDKWADATTPIIIYGDTQVEARFERVSSIQSTLSPSTDAAAVLYDLQGRRVTHPRRGIYINGVGEKTLVK